MIYQRQFIKELSWAAVGIFMILLVVLVATQAINLLGRAASGRVAIDAVTALVGFWTIGLTPVLLILTAYISIITVLTRYWRDSEMVIWLSSGLSLRNWIFPLMKFALPFAILVAVVSMLVQPWAELRSREFAELLKQKQEMSLLEPGVFREIGKSHPRVYFIESFDPDSGHASNLFVREKEKNGKDSTIFAKRGEFKQDGEKRILTLEDGFRYYGKPGQADYQRASFHKMTLVISVNTMIVDPKQNRHTIPTAALFASDDAVYKAELMWRLSLPISVIILALLALPLSYYNPRTGHTYNILIAIAVFLIYQNGLTFLRDMVENSRIPLWLGILPMHLMMFMVFLFLLRWRDLPSASFKAAFTSLLRGRS
ncbi:MAG: LPS export ABC transporter permease LptF [Snodgrassella sp.]|uniref:LPS export ABC transporter permease LptF n=1 Tax=Snodgrassella sp. TaxID=2815304 RepID=UPI00258394C9|nr:LPS export ABC transporter permease LptF [Snodgrassella sp.]MCO6512967.1 LPS export ABC transporter permease LptF [Snodgrassella sp.]MCO6520129.1 LPS export ABC transporter permease LptF [Snodgrassella sp.]